MKPEVRQIVEGFVRRAKTLGIDELALDEAVHDAKGAEAADINNGGLEAQIEYLLECDGPEALARTIESIGANDEEKGA